MEEHENDYGVASFRSRQQAVRFNGLPHDRGIPSRLISTPGEIAIGCGISVRIDTGDLQRAVDISRQSPMPTLAGFYRVSKGPGHNKIYAFR